MNLHTVHTSRTSHQTKLHLGRGNGKLAANQNEFACQPVSARWLVSDRCPTRRHGPLPEARISCSDVLVLCVFSTNADLSVDATDHQSGIEESRYAYIAAMSL
jgi:hypothetical protein